MNGAVFVCELCFILPESVYFSSDTLYRVVSDVCQIDVIVSGYFVTI